MQTMSQNGVVNESIATAQGRTALEQDDVVALLRKSLHGRRATVACASEHKHLESQLVSSAPLPSRRERKHFTRTVAPGFCAQPFSCAKNKTPDTVRRHADATYTPTLCTPDKLYTRLYAPIRQVPVLSTSAHDILSREVARATSPSR